MNPYQSPTPIEEESPRWLKLLSIASREAFGFALSQVAMLAAALMLLVVMPVAIGLAWYQFRRSCAAVDFVLATAMTFMLPLWQNTLVAGLGELLRGRV